MIEAVNERNFEHYVSLFQKMFPHVADAREECEKLYQEKRENAFLYEKDGEYTGYLGLSVRRDYVNGTSSTPVAFVEAVYVAPEARRAGIGRELMQFAKIFARENCIREVASDCLLNNQVSEQFHKACGFLEKERIICFATLSVE